MAKRGPKPLSRSQLAARGSRLASTRGDAGHVSGPCSCPDWLGDAGRAKWDELYPLMNSVPGLMRPAYIDALAMYCSAFEDFLDACEELKTLGSHTVHSEKGGVYLHPEYSRKRAAMKAMREWGALFGMSPADSTKIVTAGESNDGAGTDAFAALMEACPN